MSNLYSINLPFCASLYTGRSCWLKAEEWGWDIRTHAFRGRRYNVSWDYFTHNAGISHGPFVRRKSMRLNRRWRGLARLTGAMRHALFVCFWDLDIEALTHVSVDTSRLLWRMGLGLRNDINKGEVIHSHVINGNRYRVLKNGRHKEVDGTCDAPWVRAKCIKLHYKLEAERRLDVVIHEALHAGLWCVGEEAVAETASDTAKFLWRLGYRFKA